MEQETILYYYPLPVGPDGADNKIMAAKRRWFQEAVLQNVPIAEQEEFCVLGCAVPPYYYRKKAWKVPVLFEAMETALNGTAGMTDVWAHPDILRLLAPEMRGRWQPRARTVRMLTNCLLQQAEEVLAGTGMVTVLLGQPRETERQLETIRELLTPYLPRVNRMLLYYEGQERRRDDGETVDEEDREELQEYMEEYYYEYGLVPQLVPYQRSKASCGVIGQGQTGNDSVSAVDPGGDAFFRSDSGALRCGKERCGGLILDYGDGFRYPKIASADCVYIDVTSDNGKERLLGRKSPAIPYRSPLKYLDTLVKNSYDRKVKMT